MTVGSSDLILAVFLLFSLMQEWYIFALCLGVIGVIADIFGSYYEP